MLKSTEEVCCYARPEAAYQETSVPFVVNQLNVKTTL